MHAYFTAYSEGIWKEGDKGKTWLQEEQYVPFTVKARATHMLPSFKTQANHHISCEVLPDPISKPAQVIPFPLLHIFLYYLYNTHDTVFANIY